MAFLGDHEARSIPVRVDIMSLNERPSFERDLSALCTGVARGAVVVYLHGVSWRWEVPTEEDLRAKCGLEAIAVLSDGALYAARRTNPIAASPQRHGPG